MYSSFGEVCARRRKNKSFCRRVEVVSIGREQSIMLYMEGGVGVAYKNNSSRECLTNGSRRCVKVGAYRSSERRGVEHKKHSRRERLTNGSRRCGKISVYRSS